MAAGLPLPKRIFAHGWLLFENDKMSKSRGNIVRAEPIRQVMGADALRYFLLREIVFGQDGSFSYDALVGRYNSDLANGLGNLASRTLTMIHQYREGAIPESAGDPEIAALRRRDHPRPRRSLRPLRVLEGPGSGLGADLRGGQVHRAAGALEAGAAARTRRRSSSSSDTLYTAAEALRIATALLYPVMPQSTPKIWAQLGMTEPLEAVRFDDAAVGRTAGRPEDRRSRRRLPAHRSERSDRQDAGARRAGHRRTGTRCSARTAEAPRAPRSRRPKIAIDDFLKVDLRVGQVLSAEPRQRRRQADAHESRYRRAAAAHHRGRHRRGVRRRSSSSNRKVVIVANLQPRKLKGIESNGMIVAASVEGGKPVLAGFHEDIPVGARLK